MDILGDANACYLLSVIYTLFNMFAFCLHNLFRCQIDEREGKPSTHSYRLISIVSHLGTSSTSGELNSFFPIR